MRRFTSAVLPVSVRFGGTHPLQFGSGRRWLLEVAERLPLTLSDDARLFASAWAAGFLAFSLYLV